MALAAIDAAPTVSLGPRTGERVVIEARHAYPEGSVAADRNSIEARVEIVAGGCRAAFPAWFDVRDFARFREGVERLHRDLIGPAEFRTDEDQLALTLRGDGRGHIALRGVAADRAGGGNCLEFRLDLDQTELPTILEGLESFVAKDGGWWAGLGGRSS